MTLDKIKVRKDTKRYLKSYRIVVKYPQKNFTGWNHFDIIRVRFLTNEKGVYRYNYKVTYFDYGDNEKKIIMVGINTYNVDIANDWIENKIRDGTIKNYNRKVIN